MLSISDLLMSTMCVPCPPDRGFILKLQAFDSVGEIMLRIQAGTASSPGIYMTRVRNVASCAQGTS